MDPSFAAGGRSFGGDDAQNLLRSGGCSSSFTSPGPMQPGLSQLDILNMAAAANGEMADLNSYAYGGRRSQSAEVQRQAALAAVDSTFSPSWPPQNGPGGSGNSVNSGGLNPSQLGYAGLTSGFSSLQSGLAGSYGGAGAISAADLVLASQMGLTSSGGAAGALSAAAAASRGAFGEGPRIYVGGVPDLVTVAMVRDHFSRWGVVRDVHFPKERTSRRRRHFCFVTFESLQAAERAVAESNREIGGYPVAAINIPTDRLTHYGLRQGGLAPAPVLRGGSVYGSPGADVIGSPGASAFPGPFNVTHQIGSQRVHTQSADLVQQPDLAAQMAAASEQELAAAMAALRMGAPPTQALSALGSSSFSAGSSFKGSGMNGMGHSGGSSFNTGGLTTRSAGYDLASSGLSPAELGPQLTNLNAAMQQHLAVLASIQAQGGSNSSQPGSGNTTRNPSHDYGSTRAPSTGAALPSADSPYNPQPGAFTADAYALMASMHRNNTGGLSSSPQAASMVPQAVLQMSGSGQSTPHAAAGGYNSQSTSFNNSGFTRRSMNGLPGQELRLEQHTRSSSFDVSRSSPTWAAPFDQQQHLLHQQQQLANQLRSNSANFGRARSPATQPSNLRASSLNPDLLYTAGPPPPPVGLPAGGGTSWQQGPSVPPPVPRSDSHPRASSSTRLDTGSTGSFGAGAGGGYQSAFTSLPQDYLANAPPTKLTPIAGSSAGSATPSAGEPPHPADSGGSGLEALERNMTNIMRSGSDALHSDGAAKTNAPPSATA